MRRLPGALVQRYAKALFRAAQAANELERVRADVAAVTAVWRDHTEFALMLEHPGLPRAKARAMLLALAEQAEIREITRHFLLLLLEKDRLEILRDLSGRFEQLWRTAQGEINVTVTSAVPLNESLRSTVQADLAQRSGKLPQVAWTEDPAILGGLVIHWPDRVYDGSLRRKLQNLQRHLAEGAAAVNP